MAELQFRGLDGIRLAASGFGREQHPVVLFLHGGGQTRHSWKRSAQMVAEAGYYAITLDGRGHGDSAWCPHGQYQLNHFLGDLRCISNSLGRAVHLVGASLGGLTSLLLASEAQEKRVRSLVLVDVAATVQKAGVDRVIAFMEQYPDGFDSLEAVSQAIGTYLPHRRGPKQKENLHRVVRQRENGRYYWHWDPAFLTGKGKPEREKGAEQVRRRLEDAARGTTVPVLLLRGAMSDVVSKEDVEYFQSLVPQAESLDVSAAGHMVAGDQNDRFSEFLIDFIKRQSERA